MRLTPADLRARAAAFAADQAQASDEQRDTHTFWNAFFAIFDLDRRRIGIDERSVPRKGRGAGRIDFFWPRQLLVE